MRNRIKFKRHSACTASQIDKTGRRQQNGCEDNFSACSCICFRCTFWTLLTRLVHTKASIKFTGKRLKSNTIPVLLAYRVMHTTSEFPDQDKLLIP